MNSQETDQRESTFIRVEQLGRVQRWLRTGSVLLIALLALILLALPQVSFAQSALTDDADVSLSSGNTNHGTNPNLNVSAAENIYVKFKLSSTLPAGTPGSKVERATLKLYIGNINTAGKLDVYSVSDAWDESSITANNLPALGSLVTTTAQIGEDRRGKFLVIDITALVQQWLGDDGQGTNGLPNNGLALKAHPIDATTSTVASITFDSKENSQTSHEAQLNVQVERATDGLLTVEHDATLTGDGTSASPLGVANGAINTVHMADGAVTATKIANGAVSTSELGDGAVTSAKVTAPLSLTSADSGPTLSVENTGAGAAITATGAINTTTQYNIGGLRILSNSGADNVFAGVGAGGVNTGSGNSFFGRGSGFKNTTGPRNSFFGALAGFNNSTGRSNSFFGTTAGGSNTTGDANSFFGDAAGNENTTACCNSFFGNSAGFNNTTGIQNAFFGFAAGFLHETGEDNSFFGNFAGIGSMNGDGNTFIGSGAGFNTTNTTGSDNTSLGFQTTVIAGLGNATSIGARAQVTQSNSLVLGSISGINFATANTNVGIGTTAPKTKLHVAFGKVYVEANGQGVILKSPGGACYELTVTDAGAPATAAVACP